MHTKTVKTVITQTVSEETGELLDVQTKTEEILVKTKEEFIQIYTSIQAKLLKLTLTEERLLNYCIFNCDHENRIVINKFHRETLAKQTGLNQRTISNSIKPLCDLQLLVRIAESTYRVNPQYVWKSTSNNRKMTLQHFFKVECPDC